MLASMLKLGVLLVLNADLNKASGRVVEQNTQTSTCQLVAIDVSRTSATERGLEDPFTKAFSTSTSSML